MTGKVELSLCVIRWNDEENLIDFLENMAGLADETIVMNLASQDQILELSEKKGVTICRAEWNNSRSRLKNDCLNQAKGRWVLFLELDEYLPKEQWNSLRMLLKNPNAEEYYIYVDQGVGNSMLSTPADSLRLLRNRAEYRYQYRSFEYISDDSIANIRESNLRIQKKRTPSSFKHEKERIELLKKDQEEYPEDGYLDYIRGVDLLNQKRNEEALHLFQSAYKKANPEYFYVPHLFKCLVWADLSLNCYESAIKSAEEGISLFPDYADLPVLRGELYKRQKKHKEAIRDFEFSLKILQSPSRKAYGSEISSAAIFDNLGLLYEKEMEYKKAAFYYQQELKWGIMTPELISKAAEMMLKSGETEALELQIQEAAEKENLETLMIFIDLLYRHQEYQKVLTYLTNLEPFIEKEEADYIRYSCCLMLGRTEEAERYVSQIRDNPYFLKQIRFQEIEQKWYENRFEDAWKLLQDMAEDEGIESPAKTTYSMIHMALTGGDCSVYMTDSQDQELIRSIIDRFLWLKQPAQAQRLIPLLTMTKSAEEQTSLALWARERMERLCSWITRVPIVDSRKGDAPIYHFDKGNDFEQSGKYREAFFAYLRALQYDPFDQSVREKIRALYSSEPEVRLAELQSANWVIEGDYFFSKEEFLSYAKGVFACFAGDLAEAVKHFSDFKNTDHVCVPGFAQLVACLWMNGDEKKAEALMNCHNSCVLNEQVFIICKSYILERLEEYNCQNADSEQIRREIQKIS